MGREPRVAKPGDVCALLGPMGEDVVELRHRQRKLQERFGGRIHQPIHLTCQRFRLEGQRPRHDVIRSIVEELKDVRAFPILADALVLVEHPFWRSRLLRWRVESTLDLRMFGIRLERVLTSEGIRPHFPQERGWLPRYVTALEDVYDGDVDGPKGRSSFPCQLFQAQRLVFSVIEEQNRFRIVGETQWVRG